MNVNEIKKEMLKYFKTTVNGLFELWFNCTYVS